MKSVHLRGGSDLSDQDRSEIVEEFERLAEGRLDALANDDAARESLSYRAIKSVAEKRGWIDWPESMFIEIVE